MAPGLVYERILLPVDGGEHADRATEHAIEFARRYEAELTVLFVLWTGTPYAGPEGHGLEVGDYMDALAADGQKLVTRAAQQARDAGVTDVRTFVERSPDIGRAILDAIDQTESDLVVMGTHGRSGVSRFLIGSVAEEIVRGANVPVMTVSRPDEGDA